MNPNISGILALSIWSVLTLLITYTGSVPPFSIGGTDIFYWYNHIRKLADF